MRRLPGLGLLSLLVLPLSAQNPVLDSIQKLGGSGYDTVTSVVPDSHGNIFVLGQTTSADFPATTVYNARSDTPSGGDAFVAKIRLSDWSLQWSAVLGSSKPLALAIDGSGSAYVTGTSLFSGSFPATPGAFAAQAGSLDPLFVVKIDGASARVVYSALLAVYGIYPAPIAVDNQGQAYVASVGTGPVTPGAYLATPGTIQSGYVVKLSADGSKVLYSSYLNPIPYAIAVDSQQHAYLAGVDGHNPSVTRFSADGSSLDFSTPLGGAGSGVARYLQLASDGSIYLAGDLSNVSPNPFPAALNPGLTNGFVAKLSPDAGSIVFGTYVMSQPQTILSGFGVAGGRIYVAYGTAGSISFPGLDFNPFSEPYTNVQSFDSNNGAADPVYPIPVLTADAFAVSASDLILASNAPAIDSPVPSSLVAIGPATSKNVTLAHFLLGTAPDHDLTADRGYLYFSTSVAPGMPQTLNVASSAGSSPFSLFAPQLYTATPSNGITPASVTITGPGISEAESFILVAPHASQPIQLLPAYTGGGTIQLSAPGIVIVPLPSGGGPGTVSFQISATTSDGILEAGVEIPASVPFTIDVSSLPPFFTVTPSQGITPATITITGQLDSLSPGSTSRWDLLVSEAFSHVPARVIVIFSRPLAPPQVTPTSYNFGAPFGQGPFGMNMQIAAPDNTTSFQVGSLPPSITVAPMSGTGSAKLVVWIDPSSYPVGVTTVTFNVQVGSAQFPISVTVNVAQFTPYLYNPQTTDVAPGLRASFNAAGIANLPATGSWSNTSPAPTNWNGYTFVYRGQALPILSANAGTHQFDIQFPYDLDLTASRQPVNFTAPDNTILGGAPTYGVEQPTFLSRYSPASPSVVWKADGSLVSADNPVVPGDVIHLQIVGAGVTNPPIAAGLLPASQTLVSPTAAIQASIGGVPAAITQRSLDPQLIGVTDVYIEVPAVASGQQLLGLQAADSNVTLVPVWAVGPEGKVSQSISFGALTDEPLNASGISVSASSTSGLPVSFSSLTPAVCTATGSVANGTLIGQLAVTLVATGTCTIQAAQAGDATYLAASPVTRSFQVLPSPAVACLGTGAFTRVAQIQPLVSEALGVVTPAHDLNSDGVLNIVDLQIMTNWTLGLGCGASH